MERLLRPQGGFRVSLSLSLSLFLCAPLRCLRSGNNGSRRARWSRSRPFLRGVGIRGRLTEISQRAKERFIIVGRVHRRDGRTDGSSARDVSIVKRVLKSARSASRRRSRSRSRSAATTASRNSEFWRRTKRAKLALSYFSSTSLSQSGGDHAALSGKEERRCGDLFHGQRTNEERRPSPGERTARGCQARAGGRARGWLQ